jgi:hypothetical protein
VVVSHFLGFVLTVFVVNRIIAEKRRLEKEEADAEASLLEAHQLVTERLARLSRLRRQRETIVSKGQEMVRRGVRSLDELEGLEKAEAEAVVDVQAVGGFGVIDWTTVFEDFTDPTPPGPVDGTGGVAAGRSSDV